MNMEFSIPSPLTLIILVVDGNLRLEIAKKLELITVPVIRIEHLDEAELLAYGIAANKMPGVANIDFEALGLAFGEIETKIPDFDMRLTGFSYGEVDRIAGRQAASRYDDLDEQEDIDPSAPAISAVGQLYALGRHRLICGDSLNASTFEAVMQGEVAACCFTDPPYNVKINGNVFKLRTLCRICHGVWRNVVRRVRGFPEDDYGPCPRASGRWRRDVRLHGSCPYW